YFFLSFSDRSPKILMKIIFNPRQPYLKILAVILTVVTIFMLTHSSSPIRVTTDVATPNTNPVEKIKVPEELKKEPEENIDSNQKELENALEHDEKFNDKEKPANKEDEEKAIKPANEKEEETPLKTTPDTASKKVKATFVTLARNEELYDLIKSIRTVEDRFNRKFNYDWVFLNDKEFTQEFKDLTTAIVSGKTKYGLIPKEHWSYPDWIDLQKAENSRKSMKAAKIIYGDSESYRHMCRFESGFFWRNPLLDDYDWYWRVEPGIDIHCDLDYDLFKYMEDNNKVYGFTISIHEFRKTIETLWDTTKKFIKENPQYLAENNFMDFISDDKGETYNLCHFWSNFEIANLNFWRGEAYTKYFDYLDKTGGFFYERWGDAPIHSIAASLFLPKDKIHYFDDVGYRHGVYTQCSLNAQFRYDHKCHCSPQKDFTFRGYSCGKKYYEKMGLEKPKEWVDYQ
ncbi:Glycolipid 2-alpha-mannosyltransferase, partial [Candida maltosa Xu316]